MALKGDTVRLEVKFMDFDGILVEPTDITLSIYDEDNVAIQSIPLTTENRSNVGSYYFDYAIPYNAGEYLVYEFSGIVNDKPILARDKIQVDFV